MSNILSVGDVCVRTRTLPCVSICTLGGTRSKRSRFSYIFDVTIEECFSIVKSLFLAQTRIKRSAKLKLRQRMYLRR